MTKITQFISALSCSENYREDIDQCIQQIKEKLLYPTIDLLLVFVAESYDHFDSEYLIEKINQELSVQCIVGCNACGVIGDDIEVEIDAAISMLAMNLPENELYPFHLTAEQINRIDHPEDMIKITDVFPTDLPQFIVLSDPMSCDVVHFIDQLNKTYPNQSVLGGLSSGILLKKDNWLCLNRKIYTEGIVGVGIVGKLKFQTMISQSCKPIGEPYIITRADNNILYELSGKPALYVMSEVVQDLAKEEKKQAETSLLVGLVIDEYQKEFSIGDFLIRNIMGFDMESGALSIGAYLKEGQTLQFQLRDIKSSKLDLKKQLKKIQFKSDQTHGAIMVNCCGRGTYLYNKDNYDISQIQKIMGAIPVTGFFANGEIGPALGRNYLHGYTLSLGIFSNELN